jgi:hypothetical protein
MKKAYRLPPEIAKLFASKAEIVINNLATDNGLKRRFTRSLHSLSIGN